MVGAETAVSENASCNWMGSRRGVRREVGCFRDEGMNERILGKCVK